MSFRNFTTGGSTPSAAPTGEIVPGARLVCTDKFGDTILPGRMTTTVTLNAVSVGTVVSIEQQRVKDAIPREACYLS